MDETYNTCIHCKDGKCEKPDCVHYEQCWETEDTIQKE